MSDGVLRVGILRSLQSAAVAIPSGVLLLLHSRRLTRSLQMEIRWIEHGCFIQPVQIVDRAMPLLQCDQAVGSQLLDGTIYVDRRQPSRIADLALCEW